MDRDAQEGGLEPEIDFVAFRYAPVEHTERLSLGRATWLALWQRAQGPLFVCVASGLVVGFVATVVKILM